MKLTKIIRIMLWLAVILWMGVIFSFSSQTAHDSSDLSGQVIKKTAELTVKDFDKLPKPRQHVIIQQYQNITRKTAHVLIYTVLGMLVMVALFRHPFKKRLIISMVICVIYAITDEIHQMFVPGRSAQPSDVFIDSCGALVGIILVIILQYLYRSLLGKFTKCVFAKKN